MGSNVLVMAKGAVPWRVNSRLSPPCSLEVAAALAEAALADTLDAVADSGADRRMVALDGAPGAWLPPGFDVVPQCDGSFDCRLAHAWDSVGGPGVQIGMDTPQVTGAQLDDALGALDRTPAALGHALDGGWWAIGLRRPNPAVFRGVPMSTGRTGLAQETRLRSLGLDVTRLPDLVDFDTIGDLAAVVGAAPGSRTAQVAADLGLVAGRGVADAVVLRADTGEALSLSPSRWL